MAKANSTSLQVFVGIYLRKSKKYFSFHTHFFIHINAAVTFTTSAKLKGGLTSYICLINLLLLEKDMVDVSVRISHAQIKVLRLLDFFLSFFVFCGVDPRQRQVRCRILCCFVCVAVALPDTLFSHRYVSNIKISSFISRYRLLSAKKCLRFRLKRPIHI